MKLFYMIKFISIPVAPSKFLKNISDASSTA